MKINLHHNETLLDRASGAFGRPFVLVHVAPAVVPAGAGTRFQHECYKLVSFDRDGTRHGQAYKTLEEAKARFDQFTTPIVAIEA